MTAIDADIQVVLDRWDKEAVVSELTRCNYCKVQDLYRRHGTARVTTAPDKDGWIAVWVDGVKIGVSFLSLTDHCVC